MGFQLGRRRNILIPCAHKDRHAAFIAIGVRAIVEAVVNECIVKCLRAGVAFAGIKFCQCWSLFLGKATLNEPLDDRRQCALSTPSRLPSCPLSGLGGTYFPPLYGSRPAPTRFHSRSNGVAVSLEDMPTVAI